MARAISSLYLTGTAPSAMAALSKSEKACMAAGAFAASVFSFAMFFMSYIKGPHFRDRDAASLRAQCGEPNFGSGRTGEQLTSVHGGRRVIFREIQGAGDLQAADKDSEA